MKLPQISKIMQQFNQAKGYEVAHIAREYFAKIREEKLQINDEIIQKELSKRINQYLALKPRALINATGVILHTNLGRALISQDDWDRLKDLHINNTNLEFDMQNLERGSRDKLLSLQLQMLFGCEDAIVVNNNAAAVFLVLSTFAKGKNCLTSRGELVEIGGGFRVSEVMRESGANLIEVGTSNKTKISDYEEILSGETKVDLLLKTHKSNFYIGGFSEEVDAITLSCLAKKYGVNFYYDLGSGYVDEINDCLKDGEPSIKNLIKNGVGLLSFSGDKLFACTQAGIILGKKKFIEKIRKNQLLRMFRANKTTLLMTSIACEHYLEKKYENLPSLALLNESKKAVENKAIALQNACGFGEISPCFSLVGGGSMPDKKLPSFALKIKASKQDLHALANAGVIANYEKDAILCDLRSVQEFQIMPLANILKSIFKEK